MLRRQRGYSWSSGGYPEGRRAEGKLRKFVGSSSRLLSARAPVCCLPLHPKLYWGTTSEGLGLLGAVGRQGPAGLAHGQRFPAAALVRRGTFSATPPRALAVPLRTARWAAHPAA